MGTLEKYILNRIGETVQHNFDGTPVNAVAAQFVSGKGKAVLEVSLDKGYSWILVPLRSFGEEQRMNGLSHGEAGWANAPAITNARLRLVEAEELPCKVNLRFGRV